jgi:hypothetical protein
MSANVPISSIIEPPQFSVGKEQRVFMPAQHADGCGEVFSGKVQPPDGLGDANRRAVAIKRIYPDHETLEKW